MANLKEIRGRIKTVKNTQQVTKAMKMVAAAKLRKAQDRMHSLRPYANKLSEIISNVVAAVDADDIPSPLVKSREVNNVLIVIVTSNRGLCGGFNSNLIKFTNGFIAEHYAEEANNGKLKILCAGKKGHEYYSKRGFDTLGEFRDVLGNISFDTANEVIEEVFEGFVDGKWDKVHLLYNEFKNVMTQNRVAENFLPLAMDDLGEAKEEESKMNHDYIFEPNREEILKDLVPKSLRIRFFRSILETNAAEQGARMVAMDQATENGNELLKELKLKYNKARQAAITKEILEIASGADALEG